MKAHILVCMPSYRSVESMTTRTLTEQVYYTAKTMPDVQLSFGWRDGFPVAGCQHCYDYVGPERYEDARNFFAQHAMKIGATHLFMMDSDMAYKDMDLINRLLAHDADIVAPLFMRRSTPYDILAVRRSKVDGLWKPITVAEQRSGKLIEVDATGFGCILINLRVLEDMKYPYFVFQEFGGRIIPEDFNFCRKARRRGHKVHVDTSLHLDHIGSHVYRVKEAIAIQEDREELTYGAESGGDSEVGGDNGQSHSPAVEYHRG